MAKVELLIPKILKFEGGFVNDPVDAGGATNMGVTLGTWRQMGYDKTGDHEIDAEDMKKLSKDDFKLVLKVGYWDRWKADSIVNQSVAEILVDWVWASGAWGIKIPQRVMGLPEDGVVGIKTISFVNSTPPGLLHASIKGARIKFVDDIVKKSIAKFEAIHGKPSTLAEQLKYTNKKFEKGWLNRINDFNFAS